VPENSPEHIAIVGGGFSEVMTAVNLARLSVRPIRVTVINYRRPAGRGVAYGTRRPEHLLNVAARNISAFRDEPEHFLRWLRTRSEFDTVPEIELRERFIPRMVYGDYLRSVMHHHLQSADGMTPITTAFVAGEVLDIEPAGGKAVIHLADSTVVEADRGFWRRAMSRRLRCLDRKPWPGIRPGWVTRGSLWRSDSPAKAKASSCWAPD
jgi:uncharacterized NAD(P)/FAD-binding protein YdhS